MPTPKVPAEIYPQVSFKLGELTAAVDARADHGPPDNSSRSEAIRVMIARYESVCRRDLPSLTVAEWKLCCDALNGSMLREYPDPDGERLRFVWASIDDAIRLSGAAKKWATDGEVLVKKIRGLTQGQLVALVDFVERFWIDVSRGEDPTVPGEAQE